MKNPLNSSMNGKGDDPRNCLSRKFRSNYDRIFGKKTFNNIEVEQEQFTEEELQNDPNYNKVFHNNDIVTD